MNVLHTQGYVTHGGSVSTLLVATNVSEVSCSIHAVLYEIALRLVL